MKSFSDIQEGVYDPNIFKAIFLAGGPGSGKSFVVRKTTGGLGMKIVNSDDIYEKMLNDAGLTPTPEDIFSDEGQEIRGKAKRITAKRKANFLDGRLGLIIDGTGKDYDKIAKQASGLQKIGYETYMIFVNTTLEVALQRNELRDRVLPKSIVEASHKEVNRNIGAFQGLFGSGNFMIVDNNQAKTEEQAKKRFKMLVKQGLGKFIKTPIKSKKALSWIRKQKILDKSKGRAK